MGRPFPVVCPIEDGDVGRDGWVGLIVRHYEKIKLVSYWSFYKVETGCGTVGT